MSILTNHMLMAAAGARGGALSVADVFKTTTYSGNGAATRIFGGGPDMAGLGGLALHKARNETDGWVWEDSVRGAGNWMNSASSSPSAYASNTVKSFNSDGVTIGNDVWMNQAGDTYVQYLIARSPKFFDVITYTGDGVAGRTIAHTLGVEPGMIVVKRRDTAENWYVSHNYDLTKDLRLNSTSSESTNSLFVGTDESQITLNLASSSINASGATYVAYIFAHDPVPNGLIQCGSYTGTGTGGNDIDLGWEAQWVMIKRTDSSGDWYIYDNQRVSGSNEMDLFANTSDTDQFGHNNILESPSNGFTIDSADAGLNASGGEYIYMAIRAEGV